MCGSAAARGYDAHTGGLQLNSLSMQITLPRELEEFAAEQARRGGHARVSDYIHELLIRERLRQPEARVAVERRLHEALASHRARELEPDWKEQVRSAARRADVRE